MTKLRQFLGGLICTLCGWMLTACSSDEDSLQIPEGKGYVKLNLTADAGFQTKAALDESTYQDKENYTVQILDKEDGSTIKNWKYAEIPEGLIELANGSYVLKAFCGEDKNASTTSMNVEGTSDFDINGDQKEVSVTCAPVCARVTIVGEGMDEQFSDWSAMIGTKAQGSGSFYQYPKDGDPVSLKVEKGESISVNFTFTPKSGSKTTTASKNYTVNPNEALKITLKPGTSESGKLGITITIDGSTNDETINIEIPADCG